MTRRFATALVLFVAGPPLLARSEDPRPGTVLPGERLDPGLFGPGVIEPMSVVLERDRTPSANPESSDSGRNGRQGRWVIPSRNATYRPHSGDHNVVNEWGDTRMGIGFPGLTDVECAYFSGQAGEGAWTTGIRIIGYRRGEEVAATDWFTGIGQEPVLFEIGLRGVDRIELQATPRIAGAGWYAMDDLTFTPRSGDATVPDTAVSALTRVLDFEDCDYKQALTDSGYAGLTWETGFGDFRANQGIPSPQTMPEDESGPPPDAEPDAGVRGSATPPDLLFNFQGVIRGDAGSFSYPPDTCGAVGPNHFVEVVNDNLSIYLKSNGSRVTNTRLTSFLPGSAGDPRVLYDQYSGRWVIINDDFNSRVYLAVSLTNDPTGSWFKTSILLSQGADAGCWPDYPTLGVNASGIYTCAYMVGCSMSIFAIDKAPLVAPVPSLGTVTAYRTVPWEGAIQPVQTYGAEPAEYFVSRFASNGLRVRKLTGPMTAPTLTEQGVVTVPSYFLAEDVPASGSDTDLDSVDSRLMNAVFRDGSVWTCHTVGVSSRAACRWYQADVASMTLVQSGTVSDSVLHYFFPSIAVNSRGDAVMGFSGSSAVQYAAAYYTGRLTIDPPGLMAPPALLRAGGGPQNNLDQYGRNRWGDYSLTTLDPADERVFWTIQEYGHSTNIWGTHVGKAGYVDCDHDGTDDIAEITSGTSQDCNENLLPDECELTDNDCDANQTPDDCQIAAGTPDCDIDGVPDTCEPDCNANSVADDCDLAAGTSGDCQANGVPDECEIASGASHDCTANGTPDECETDCNQNGYRDDCDMTAGTSRDCNVNQTPDECDIAARLSLDCNASGVPDECDLAVGTSGDCNTNAIPDECDSEVCYAVWGGFEPAPPFTAGVFVHGIDSDGDGSAWQNPTSTATITSQGCPASAGKALKSVAQTPSPTEFYTVTSEYFRTLGGGELPFGAPFWALSFDVRSEAQLNPRVDWQLSVKDAESGGDVMLIHWASTQSAFGGVSASQKGRILVQNPAGSPTFLSSGFAIPANSCYNLRVVLDNVAGRVDLYINGTLRLSTTPLQAGAQRIDYFALQQRQNNQAAGGVNRLALDNFTVCQTGAELAPGGAPDCNQNTVWDQCDIADGTSADADSDGTPDECEAGAPAATVTGAVARKTCDLLLLPARQTEPRQGGVTEVRIAFDVSPGGPGATPVTVEQATCAAPTFVAYSGASSISAGVAGNELVVTFTPGLENARTYRLNIGPQVTSVTGQFVEVRGLVGDVTSDGLVNAGDRSAVVGVWTGSGVSCGTDVNSSGQTDAGDRSAIVGAWTSPQNCAP